jgi:K+-sensing histidine kinase KdpD
LKTATVIKLSGKRLLQLIYDILAAACMKHGTMNIKYENVDMEALLGDVVELAGALVHKDVDFLTSMQAVPCIVGDTGRVAQVRPPCVWFVGLAKWTAHFAGSRYSFEFSGC